MINSIACPHCKHQIYILDSEDEIDLLCSNCKSRYIAAFATLNTAMIRIKPTRNQYDRSYRIYDLRVVVRGQIQPLEFTHSLEHKELSLIPNDRLLMLRTLHGHKLALVQNLAASWFVPFINSATGHMASLIGAAGLVLALGYVLGITVLQAVVPSKYAPYAGMGLVSPIAIVLVNKRRRPRFIETDEKAIAQLSREQKLLQRMGELQEKLEALRKKKQQQLSFQDKFGNLSSLPEIIAVLRLYP